MITMQQLEELENRVIKALHLIGELRSENAKLENENESLKGEVEDVKLTLEEKEQEIDKVRRELDLATKELKDLKDKEDTLEKKIISLLGKLDVLQGASAPAATDFYTETFPSSEPETVFEEPSAVKDEDSDLIIESGSENVVIDDVAETEQGEEELKVETVEPSAGAPKDEDDEIIIIDDEDELSGKSEQKTGDAAVDVSHDEDEIILLDDEDEIVIEDVHDDEIIIDDEDFEMADESAKEEKSRPEIEDEDEIIIIEDDDVK